MSAIIELSVGWGDSLFAPLLDPGVDDLLLELFSRKGVGTKYQLRRPNPRFRRRAIRSRRAAHPTSA